MRRITVNLSDGLHKRLLKYLYDTYGLDRFHGKITLTVEEALTVFLDGKEFPQK